MTFKRKLLLVAGFAVLLGALRATIFRPMNFPYTQAVESAGVGYWDLDTGSRLAYVHEAAETPEPSPVIFVHGGPGLAELMSRDVLRAVSDAGFDAYSYHQFGAGLSSRATAERENEYTVARHVADLEAIRALLGAERVILVGQSWGATLSASYAAAHAERIDRLVFTSPGPAWLPAFEREQILTLNNLDDADQLELARLIRPYVRKLAFHSYLRKIHPAVAEWFLSERQLDAFTEAQTHIVKRAYVCEAEAARDASWPGQGYWVNRHVFTDLRRVGDPRPQLAAVAAPVLILRGECDYVDEAVALDFRDAFTDARMVRIPGAGHELRLEQPELYLESLVAFLLESGSGSEEAVNETDERSLRPRP